MNLKNTLCTLCLRGWEFHAKPVFIFNMFSCDYFDAFIIEVLYICLVKGVTLEEDAF